MTDVIQEFIVDGKPISEWAEGQNWIKIGSWQIDPKFLSIKWIEETIEWERQNAKVGALQEFRDLINEKNRVSDNIDVVVQDGEVYLDAQKILDILDIMIEQFTPESKLPTNPDLLSEEKV